MAEKNIYLDKERDITIHNYLENTIRNANKVTNHRKECPKKAVENRSGGSSSKE